ncbi:hypothetical protein [Burkholderia ubonensis]|uniref:hypothetical protein n=1 Tax=Burkholderia ubonensis TaxID=101571 RepID=UPI0012FA4C5D|nr:hypothetical protein [Burkholderia ubonensis]
MATKKRSKLPDPNSFRDAEFLGWLFKESERASVVLGGAVVDEELLALLLKVMRPVKGSEDRLFEPERPLGAFSARITLAHRMGLIDDEFAGGLHAVRNLRNHFAHHAEMAQFSDAPIRDRVMSMVAWARKNQNYDAGYEQALQLSPRISEPHRHWVVCVAAIVARLKAGRGAVKPVDCGWQVTILRPSDA